MNWINVKDEIPNIEDDIIFYYKFLDAENGPKLGTNSHETNFSSLIFVEDEDNEKCLANYWCKIPDYPTPDSNNGWTPIKEQMPPKGVNLLVTYTLDEDFEFHGNEIGIWEGDLTQGDAIAVKYFENNKIVEGDFFACTHWIIIPEL